MKQVIQSYKSGTTALTDIPVPVAKDHCVLIRNVRSLVSAGTEKMILELSKKSLLGKAQERPDHVRRVLQKLSQEGFFNTLAQVSAKLDEPLPLGYSSTGVVLACGKGVQGFRPGERVASNGPHAEVVCVPASLCAHVPDAVSFDHASFTVLGAIALQGVRLAQLGLGDTAFVIGLGLVGQLTVALLAAQGCRVVGTDLDESKCALAMKMGASHAASNLGAADVSNLTRGLGADAVLITASTKSDAPVELAGEAVRKKGRVVAVGAVGLNLPRQTYFRKEAEFVVSCSYGPGRYDPVYEERGNDYPAAYVRWTEQRNMQAFLDLLAAGRIDPSPLISHRFAIEKAEDAYQLLEKGTEPYLGIILEYSGTDGGRAARRLELKATAASGKLGVGFIGAGNFARSVLIPAVRKTEAFHPRLLCSAGGLSAGFTGRKLGFEAVTTDVSDVLSDPGVQVVFIATRHNQHAEQVAQALSAGKHVFVEKPMAITVEQLLEIQTEIENLKSQILMVGFNRRFSPAAGLVKDFFAHVEQPLTVSIRFNAGEIPADHWTQDETLGGGRIIGEACHAIDLATFLAGSRPVRVFAESVGGPESKAVTDDQCFITLRHANGSISSIAYLAGGDRAYPKERVEVLGGGRLAVIDDFSEVVTVANGKSHRSRLRGQDKGHYAEVEAFAHCLTEGLPAPIAWEDLRAVTLASILAVLSIREGVPFDIP